MAPRNRTIGRGLPENLKVRRRYGKLYYAYKHPITGREFGLGSDRQHAIETARAANRQLMPSDGDLTNIMGPGYESLGKYIDRFVSTTLPGHRSRKGKRLAPNTETDYRRMLLHVKNAHGKLPLAQFGRRRVADFLEGWSPVASNKYRAALSLMFRYAVAEGRVEVNPIEGTMPKPEEVARQRLSLEGFLAVRDKAYPYLQNAMDLALQTLQGRYEIANLRFEDERKGALWVRRRKTGACLRIAIEPPLRAVIARCRDDLASPYFVHRQPERKIRTAWRDHWTQVAPETLSRGFRKAREVAGFYAHLGDPARPTFHEIRSLGADLYRKAGIDPQALLGHTSARMTAHYLEGHEHWVDVSAGLEL